MKATPFTSFGQAVVMEFAGPPDPYFFGPWVVEIIDTLRIGAGKVVLAFDGKGYADLQGPTGPELARRIQDRLRTSTGLYVSDVRVRESDERMPNGDVIAFDVTLET